MHARTLAVPHAVEFTPPAFTDDRGLFTAPFQEPAFLEAVGHPMTVAQVNHSVSRRGTIRGIHFADVPPGQGKYIYCPKGSLLDVVVDLRTGSPTYGTWDTVTLDSRSFRGVYLAEGLGHGFIALEDDTVVSYLCSTSYNPPAEHGIDPLDPELGLPWPVDVEYVLSAKDRAAPSLAEAYEAGLLPRYEDCLDRYAQLRAHSPA